MVVIMNRSKSAGSAVELRSKHKTSVINIKSLRKLIFIFQVLALITVLFLHTEVSYTHRVIFAVVLVGGVYAANFFNPRITNGDNYILLIALLLFSIGSIMIYRLEPTLAVKQVIWLGAGLAGFFATYFILKFFKGWENRGLLYFIVILGLFLITLVFGSVRGGAQNWIVIGGENGFMIQPTEFIKIVLVFLVAYNYANYTKVSEITIKNYKVGNYLLMVAVYIFIGMLFLQAELGTALIFYALLFINQFIYEENKKQIVINLVLAIVGAVVAYILFDHIKVRVNTWLDPWKDIDNTGYQITQSLFAIGSGGFFGAGIGMGKPDLIPRAYTDFIFSAICEEMGIFAGIGVIMLFLILVYRGFKIALSQENKFYSIVALGISVNFAIQAFIIFGGVMKLIPLTGITVPFVTYGGSSILASFIALGVLQYTSETISSPEVPDAKRE